VREWTHGNLQRAVAPPEEGGGGGEGRGGRRPGGAEHAAGERHCLASLLRLKEFWGRRLLFISFAMFVMNCFCGLLQIAFCSSKLPTTADCLSFANEFARWL